MACCGLTLGSARRVRFSPLPAVACPRAARRHHARLHRRDCSSRVCAAIVAVYRAAPFPFGSSSCAALLTVTNPGSALTPFRARLSLSHRVLPRLGRERGRHVRRRHARRREPPPRPRSIVFPLMLLTAFVAFSPRWSLWPWQAALTYNVAPVRRLPLVERTDVRPAHRAFLGAGAGLPREALRTGLPGRGRPDVRYWEALATPGEDPLARGWYRQIDIARTRALHEKPLMASGYRSWLRRMASLRAAAPDPPHARARRARPPCSVHGATRVFGDATPIYELPRAEPILRARNAADHAARPFADRGHAD